MTPEELKEEIEFLDGINSELQANVEQLKDELKSKDDTLHSILVNAHIRESRMLRMTLFLSSAMFCVIFTDAGNYSFWGYLLRVLLLSIVGTLPPLFLISGFRHTVFKQWTAVPAIVGSSIACALILVLLVVVRFFI